MDKKERYERYKYLQGLSAWDIGCYKDKDLRVVVNDGPNGLRKPISSSFIDQSGVIKTVCTPTISALAASFSPSACYNAGVILAKECLYHGTNILLGPGVNIKRNALCGRNFEYFSEDPYLTGILASNYVNGLEDNNVGACIKHYACNNQEFARLCNSSELSLRALNEIYLRGFKYIFKYSKPSSVMTSYNKINGTYVNESKYLINKKIRQEYNYKGLIMSDWCAVSDKGKTISTGLNIEMPISVRTDEYIDRGYNDTFNDDDLLARDLETYEALKKFKDVKKLDNLNLDDLHNDALKIAEETMVLVKNDNYLPLKKEEKVLFLGYFASHSRYVGGGSGWVNAYYAPTLIDVLNKNDINYDFVELYDEEKVLVKEEDLKKLNSKYDKVVLLLGQYDNDEYEGGDRLSLELRKHQIEAFNLVKDVFKKLATVIVTGSVVNISDVYTLSDAVMISYLAGEAQNEALYNNLYGVSNPSGRLPETWISTLDQNPIYKELQKKNLYYSYYDDDIYVGYRYYDLNRNGFMLPFGYGLSYSNFSYSNYNIRKVDNKIVVSLDVTNNSDIKGFDVILVFVGKKDSNIYRPLKELKGFKKVCVNSLDTISVDVIVDIDDISVYEENTDKFVIEDGIYNVMVCKNAFDVIHSFEICLDGKNIDKCMCPKVLVRKEEPKEVSLDTPNILMKDNEIFMNELKSLGKGDYFSYHEGILLEPLRRITYEEDLGWNFEFLEALINKINND